MTNKRLKKWIVFCICFIITIVIFSTSTNAELSVSAYGCPAQIGETITIEKNTILYSNSTSNNEVINLENGATVNYAGDWTDNRMYVRVQTNGEQQSGWIDLDSIPTVLEQMYKHKSKKYLQLRESKYGAPYLVEGLPIVYENTEASGDYYEYNIPIGAIIRCLYVSGNSVYCEYNGYKGWIYSNAFMPTSLGNVGGAFENEKIPIQVSDVSGGGSSNNGNNGGSSSSGNSNSNSLGGDPSLGNLDDYGGSSGSSTRLENMTEQILGVIQAIGTSVAVIMLIVIGIKYMLGSIEERAEYKETLKPYLIGAFILFSGSTVPQIIYQIAKNF